MYIQKISIQIQSQVDKAEAWEAFEMLTDYYRGSGQVQGFLHTEYWDGQTMVSMPYTHERNSLSVDFNNFYVNRQIPIIEALCGSKLQFETQGVWRPGLNEACNCEKRDFLIMAADYSQSASPLLCGSCSKFVPLYLLPQFSDRGYRPLLSWQSNYKACDKLQMTCEVGEQWALRQMQDIDSQLTRQGRALCEKLEALTGLHSYYYLYNYRQPGKADKGRKCPSCQGEWLLAEPLFEKFHFLCKNCRLVSNFSIR